MKILIASIMFSAFAFSSVCEEISGLQIGDLEDKYTKVGESSPILPKGIFEAYIPGFKYEECLLSIKQDAYKIGDEFIFFYYTHADQCDGGNSYGSVVNEKGKVFGDIADSFIDC